MSLSVLPGGEENPLYHRLKTENYRRYYDFMNSMIGVALSTGQSGLSQSFIKNLNCHAIAGLHEEAGQYRSGPVIVGNDYRPPASGYVPMLMEEFTNTINYYWETADPLPLSTFALWRITNIHPFVNGNGRTARAVFYFILCAKSGGFLPQGSKLLEIIHTEPNRNRYVEALKKVDANDGKDLSPLITLVAELIQTTSL